MLVLVLVLVIILGSALVSTLVLFLASFIGAGADTHECGGVAGRPVKSSGGERAPERARGEHGAPAQEASQPEGREEPPPVAQLPRPPVLVGPVCDGEDIAPPEFELPLLL